MINKTCTATALALAISTITATRHRTGRPASGPWLRRIVHQRRGPAARTVRQFISGLARDAESQPGVADNEHALAAGGYTDEQFINTCN